MSTARGLQIRDTADYKPALPETNSRARNFFLPRYRDDFAMWQFIFKRLLHMIPLLLGVSLLTFLLMSLAPGDYFTALSQNPQISPETIARLKAKFHLGEPWYVP
jgi:hypothetical protein